MGKRNKVRYQSEEKIKITIPVSGKVYLWYVEDELIQQAQKGDLMVYPQNDALQSTRLAEYDGTGFVGYFKVDIHDGKKWCPLLLQDIFPDREHNFSRTERPIDTYELCKEKLIALTGKLMVRTYREHYMPDDSE